MTEQELKEYAWELGERLSHLQTALGRLDYHEHVDCAIAEIMELKLTPYEGCCVLSTIMIDYGVDFGPQLCPSFEQFRMLAHEYVFSNETKNVDFKLGRRPE